MTYYEGACAPRQEGVYLVSNNVTRRTALITATAAAAGLALGAREAGAAEAADETAEQVVHASADVVRFLYIDNKEQEAGAEQSVVVALELGSAPAAGSLVLSNLDTGEELTVESTGTTDASLLFSLSPEANGTYVVSQVAVTLADGTSHLVDFGDCDAAYRTFSVGVSTDASDEGEQLSVTALDESGASVEEASVEDGLATTVAATVPAATAVAAAAPVAAPQARSATGDPSELGVVLVALDPGHGGNDSGAVGVNGAHEADLNWKISDYCRQELETYAGVQIYVTRKESSNPTIEQRVVGAVGEGADVVVSQHLNSLNGKSYGAEVWAPSSVDYNHDTHTVGKGLGEEILDELDNLGLYNRGVRFRLVSGPGEDAYDYADGSTGDYYGVIRYARKAGIPGIIIEHAFIDNSSDYNSYLNSDEKLRELGVADATGIASYYGLTKASEADFSPVYDYAYYTSHNSGVPSGRDAAFKHFLHTGMKEGYQASEGFSPAFYKNNNADLRRVFGGRMASYYYHYLRTGRSEGRAGTGSATAVVTLWRLYNPYTGEHFYTSSDYERNVNVYQGWTYEGIGWEAPTEGQRVYRLYNGYVSGGDHHYTMDAAERDALIKEGWTYESDAATWYSGGDVPLYRQYNPYAATGTHNYTTSTEERDYLLEVGWRDENIAWYGIYGGQQA